MHPFGGTGPTTPRTSGGPTLRDGSDVAVIGGGPAGSFFAYFLLQMAKRARVDVRVDVYEPRDFSGPGSVGCNMCGGIVSESLLQHLATEGIRLPPEVIQRRIDSYFLHMDVGSVRIETPLREKRIAAVYRGGGPRGTEESDLGSFDAYLLALAAREGARLTRDRVTGVGWRNGRPRVTTQGGLQADYDLLVGAVGVNSAALKIFENLGLAYRAPGRSRAYVCEFHLGSELVERYMGSSMHVFLLNIPRLEFAAIIPKSSYVTVCLLGQDVDKILVEAFLNAPEVRECMPPHWRPPSDFCRCAPRINVRGAARPFADRIVFIGDCATTRLYKDGIGAAYRTAKAAAVTAVFEGVSAEDFRRQYWPTCRAIARDNRLGHLMFAVTRRIQGRGYARRGVWRMVSREQQTDGGPARMSSVLWDTFTGSASYGSVLRRSLHPAFLGRLLRETASGGRSTERPPRPGRLRMATGATGLVGRKYRDGEVIYHQREKGSCMYVIQEGQVEVVQRQGDKEFCLAVLGDGDFFGEMGLFEEDVRSATVRASGDVVVFTLERKNLLRRLHEDPSLAFRIIERMSHRIRELETALVREASFPTLD